MKIKIDPEKLMKEINKHVFEITPIKTYEELSLSLGYSKTYIYNCLKRGQTGLNFIEDLFNTYGIELEDYISLEHYNSKPCSDAVNHPEHYEGNIECIDAMKEVLGTEGLINFCIGNAFKYTWRCKKKHKSPVEDLKKADWYINKAIELMLEED